MTSEWVTAVATAGTFLVIAASAVAALLQLRHMRGGNQIVALTECREQLESREFQEARQFITNALPALLENEDLTRRLKGDSFPSEMAQISYVANFFESMGAFVRHGIIDRTIACDLWCGVVLVCWEALLPVIRMRREHDPGIWENFEYLAVVSKNFLKEHPTSYPTGLERMPL